MAVRADAAAQLDGLATGHRVPERSRHRELHAPQVEEGDVDLQAFGDLAHAVVEHRVAEIHSTPWR